MTAIGELSSSGSRTKTRSIQGAAGAVRRETTPPQETLYLNLRLGGEGAAQPLTGVFIPEGFIARPAVDVILYLHGHHENNPRVSIDGYWNARRFPYWPLREGLNASGRNAVLIAPTLGPHSQAGWLVRPGGLDAYLTRVLGDLRQSAAYRGASAPPSLANLILACHSGGGSPMKQLATGSDRAATLIRECWGFDCLYNTGDERSWAAWAKSRPAGRLFIYYLGSTQTKSRALARLGVPNITVARSRASDHNSVPKAHWRERIEGTPFLQPRTGGAPTRPGAPAPPAAPTVPAAPRRPATAGNTPRCPPPSQLTPAQRTVLAVTTNFETGVPFGCAVSKVDGISMGMLQWNLKAGTLQALFRQYESAGGRLETHLGAEAPQVRALIALPPAQGVTLATTQGLANRWRDGLRALCGDPAFCNLQVRDIASRLRTAEIATRELGLRTVRGLSMMFDIQVGDGYGARRRKIGLFRDRIARRGSSSERERLVEIANEAAEQAGARWREERRARRLVIANGTGRYRGSMWDLDRLFPGLDQLWEGGGGGAAPAPAPSPQPQPQPQRPRPRDGLEPIHPERDRTRRPATPGRPAPLASGCSVPARPMNKRCLHPGTHQCPAISNLLCLTQVDGTPFEAPLTFRRDPATGITVVQSRDPKRRQQFVPPVHTALQQFIANSRRFGLPFEAILTAGSLVCRCQTKSDTPSNHSFGDAIDVVGVRWPPVGGPASRFRETIVHNFRDPEQRALLRRLNACLRLSFATVIDYHRADHQDHFHCDMNRGRGRTFGPTTLRFAQEALSLVLGRSVPITGRLDAATKQALKDFARGGDAVWSDRTQLARTLDQLFTRVAMGR